MSKHIVVVESPAKAKTINKYLGKDYTVLASYGHVRDLPSKNGSVKPEDDFSMVWETNARGKTQIKEIQNALKNADSLLLATDPDREGEAISWHILQLLEQKKALKGKKVERIVFHEITPTAIKKALNTPRDIDQNLVDSYLARRSLDYLVGFSLSPILWRKLPGSRSAGRVQSVALRLISERENEIELFVPREYWSLYVDLESKEGKKFQGRLTHIEGKKADKFEWTSKQDASTILERLKGYNNYLIDQLNKKKQNRHPSPPFTTSTLQQEAARKLGFSAQRTMSTAQKLYEGVNVGGQTIGLITYMRTDSVIMAQEAITAVRSMIDSSWGKNYLPKQARAFKTKSKNAQEAHEAIRPTNFSLTPEKLPHLDGDLLKLYTLIWRRAVASQMASAELELVQAKLLSNDSYAGLTANGSTLVFDGFLKLYQEGKDDVDQEDSNTLPVLHQGDSAKKLKDNADQHFTQPPPRYTEASLVKKLEELGIGRPSTYASIIQVLIGRNYVTLDKKRFVPESRGRVVTSFLENYFDQYVQYYFTADLENKLDDVAEGTLAWKKILKVFWQGLDEKVGDAQKLKISDVLEVLTKNLAPFLWPCDPGQEPDLSCPKCKQHKLSLKVGRFGAFIGCADYPTCTYTRKLSENDDNNTNEIDKDLVSQENDGDNPWPKVLGKDENGAEITLRKGPYGMYVQMGEAEGKKKPKRAGLPKSLNPQTFTLDMALSLLTLPREVALDPITNTPVLAGLGRFGPYLKVEDTFYALPKDENILTLEKARALEILEEKRLAKKDTQNKKKIPRKRNTTKNTTQKKKKT